MPMRDVQISHLEALPKWAFNVLLARQVRRLAQLFAKLSRSHPRRALFEQYAAALDSRVDSNPIRLSTASECSRLLTAEVKDPALRGPLNRLAAMCDARSRERAGGCINPLFYRDGCLISKYERKQDDQLHGRTLAADWKRITALAASNPVDPRPVDLGPLWPLGEPAWLHAEWLTLKQQRQRERRIWGEDAPSTPCRVAPLKAISTDVGVELRRVLEPTSFAMQYAGTFEWSQSQPSAGKRSVTVGKQRARTRRITLRGSHGFRLPANSTLIDQYQRLFGKDPSLLQALAFFALHDGALLFRVRGSKPSDSHLQLLGLADQKRAMALVLYWMAHKDLDDPGSADEMLRKYGLSRDGFIVIANAGSALFLLVLRGKLAGRVLRYLASAQRIEPWASSFHEAIVKCVSAIDRLSNRSPLAYKFGDESCDGYTDLVLKSVKPLACLTSGPPK